MVQQRPFTVTFIGTPDVDISEHVIDSSIKRQGTGRIRVASLMLDANEGAFITNSDIGGSGMTPIIATFQKIKIEYIDENGDSKKLIGEVDQILKQKTVNGKTLLPLELKGRERALQDIKTFAFYKFKDPNYAINDLRLHYNLNQKGNDQPVLLFVNPDLTTSLHVPKTLKNVYDFSAGVSYYDAIMHIVTRLNQPIGQGGINDFYSVTFEDDPNNDNTIICTIQIQGTTSGGIPTLESTEDLPFNKITNQTHSPVGTQVFVRGTPNTGYMPTDFHRFQSFVEEIGAIGNYISTETYKEDQIVNVDNVLYIAIQDVPTSTPPPNATYWAVTNPDSIIGALNYSPWTKDKAAVIKNSCSHPENNFVTGGFAAPAFPDGNLVIRDGINPSTGAFRFFRDFAWFRVIDPDDIEANAQYKKYIFNEITLGIYNGLTVLVDESLGSASGVFAGTDRYGRTYANSIVMWDGEEWIVIREPQVGDQCCILYEGIPYEWNVPLSAQNDYANAHRHSGWPSKQRGPSGSLAWRDISATSAGIDMFHHPTNIENVEGLFPSEFNGQDYSNFTDNSAIKVTYTYNPGGTLIANTHTLLDKVWSSLVKYGEQLIAGKFDEEFTLETAELDRTKESIFSDFGWWYAQPFPYPFNTLNGISEDLGEIYGGVLGTATRFAALDIQNANFSHGGYAGINHEQASDLGGPFTGLHFYFLFDILIGGVRQPFQGDIPFTVTVYDDLRQVWRADYTYRILGQAEEIFLPFSQFTVNRPSRTPFAVDSAIANVANIVVPEIEIRSIFEERRVRLITIQFAQAYDEHMRYLPVSVDRIIRTAVGTTAVTFEGTLDGIALTKQPFVSSGIENDRVINPAFIQATNVRNLRQLESIALAQKDLAGLPFEQFVVEHEGRCDMDVEQSVYLTDIDLINESDDSNPNTRKLILMTDELSYHSEGEKSGFVSTRTLTKRLGGP